MLLLKKCCNFNEIHKIKGNEKNLSFWCIPITFAFWILLFYLSTFAITILPTPLTLNDEIENPNRFIAERAQNHVLALAEFGPKVAGSNVNENDTITYLINEINKIQLEMNAAQYIEFDDPLESGGFHIDFKPNPMTSVYQQIRNFVVKLSPVNKQPPFSLLINTHFDTVPISPGSGDAGVMVSVMLEVLRILAKSPNQLEHSIVFLFNGAEENALQGSHPFITKHSWATRVRAFINLDSAGTGGREIMFQAGPEHPWLMKYYASVVPHPFASAIGEELFQSNIIPSDTDFRIFRDYGNIPGMDLAYSSNGYVYHTKYDTPELIPLGTYQHTGDNLLELVKALGNAPELEHPEEFADGKIIYFDFMGWFMIHYIERDNILINTFIGLASLIIIILSLRAIARLSEQTYVQIAIEYGLLLLVQLGSIILGIGISLILATIYDAANRSMSWYSANWLLFGLYFNPLFIGLGIGPIVYFKLRKKIMLQISFRVQMLLHAQCLIFTILLFVFTGLGIRSIFLITIPVLFFTFTSAINLFVKLQNKVKIWPIIHMIGQILPFMFISYLTIIFYTILIPIQARGGPSSNPELLICLLSVLLGLLLSAFIIPLISLCNKPLSAIIGFLIITFIFIIIMVTPVGFPYTKNISPQRYWIFHTERTFNNNYFDNSSQRQDSGYFMLSMDRHSPDTIKDIVPRMKFVQSIEEDCDKILLCGVPFYTSRMLRQSRYSHWIPAEKPYLNVKTTLISTGIEDLTESVRRYSFVMEGPSHMGIYLSPLSSAKLTKWRFTETIPPPSLLWNGDNREIYFIYFAYANDNSPYHFFIDIETSSDWIGPTFDIAITGHYTHFDEEQTTDFKEFILSFPEWAHVTPWMSSYENWQF